MASADSPPGFVCVNCKVRKKKCDKRRPSCGYCILKRLDCQYEPLDAKSLVPPKVRTTVNSPSPFIRSSLLLAHTLSDVLMSEPKNADSTLYLQVLRIIRTTGQFVDDMSVRYFRGIHHFIPIISRSRFHHYLVDFGTPPPASFSMILLSMCLTTYHPNINRQTENVLDQDTLYLATKTLFSQAQASYPPSLHLCQAGTIIAIYEYASGKITEALATITASARIGYATRLHLANPIPETELYLQTKEEANTWWGIVICERIIFCELDNFQQPFIAIVPNRDTRLPTDPGGMDYNPPAPTSASNFVCHSTLFEADGFGSMIQAIRLLDQVFRIIDMPDLNSRLIQLDGLDNTLQAFLAVIMNEAHGRWGSFCAASAIVQRALFILHRHILAQIQLPYVGYCKHKSSEEWRRSSLAALDTLVTIADDIAASQHDVHLSLVDNLPPSGAYLIISSLRHIDDWKLKTQGCGTNNLRASLRMFNDRWNAPERF